MQRFTQFLKCSRPSLLAFLLAATLGLMTAVACFADLPDGVATIEQVAMGRRLVISHECDACHSGGNASNPSDPTWLSGYRLGQPDLPYEIGPFKTYPRSLTPDDATGLGRFSDRQIFNALRYGLKPGDTPDVVITSSTPGQGNFPANPRYLAIPMPWPSFRHLPDEELWAIVAYLKHGIKAVSNKVPGSQGPPDFWASDDASEKIGPYPLPAYPAGNEEFRP